MSSDREHADLLAAWRAEHDPGASERERMWEGIAARAATGDPLLEEAAPASTAATTAAVAASRSRVLVGGVALAAAAVLAIVIASPRRELARTVEPALQQSLRAVLPALERATTPVVAPATIAPTVQPEPAVGAPLVGEPLVAEPHVAMRVPPRRGPARREPPRSDAAPGVAPAPSIDPVEVELLERAQRRLASDPKAALALFDAHAQSYPRSALAAERELGRADARCRSGDTTGARELVDGFIRTRPGSPLVARVRSICADAP